MKTIDALVRISTNKNALIKALTLNQVIEILGHKFKHQPDFL